MKNRVKHVLIFLAGLFVGGLVIAIFMGRLNQQQYANSYTLSVMEKAFEATELRAHRHDELANELKPPCPKACWQSIEARTFKMHLTE